jgi:hypothetical protein
LIGLAEKRNGGADAGYELARGEDAGAFAPTEDPALDLLEAAELHAHLDGAIGGAFDFLGGVPLALADELAGEGVEADADIEAAVAGEDAEAFAEVLADGEVGRAMEAGGGAADGAHALEDEGADLLALEVEAEEVPLVRDAAEVVGADAAGLVGGAFGFFVFELDLAGLDDGFADGLEDVDVGGGGAKAAEGDGGVDLGPLEVDAVAEAVADFLESGAQRALEGGAAVLLEGLACDEEGDDLAAGDLDVGKAGDGLRVVEAELDLVVLDGEAEAVAHEVDIALDGLWRDFELVGEFAAIGVCGGLEALVEAEHALERWAGEAAWEGLGVSLLGGRPHTGGIEEKTGVRKEKREGWDSICPMVGDEISRMEGMPAPRMRVQRENGRKSGAGPGVGGGEKL